MRGGSARRRALTEWRTAALSQQVQLQQAQVTSAPTAAQSLPSTALHHGAAGASDLLPRLLRRVLTPPWVRLGLHGSRTLAGCAALNWVSSETL